MKASTITDRLLGLNRIAEIPNTLTVIITGNNATFSPSLRRRSMLVELFLPEAKFEDHVFKKSLELEDIQSNRTVILGALWSLVREWEEAGRPPAPLKHGSFNSAKKWFGWIGPILYHAGFGPLEALPANLLSSGDRETSSMEALVKEMDDEPDGYTFAQLADLAQQHELFSWFLCPEGGRDRETNTTLGYIFKRYDQRLFSWVDTNSKTRETWRFVTQQNDPTNRHKKTFHKVR